MLPAVAGASRWSIPRVPDPHQGTGPRAVAGSTGRPSRVIVPRMRVSRRSKDVIGTNPGDVPGSYLHPYVASQATGQG